MTGRLVGIAAVAVLTAVALVGCNDGDAGPTGSPATQSATATSASPSSTPTPTKSLTPAEQDLADAEQSITDYWKALDAAASDPKSNLNKLATVARGQALAQWQSTLAGYRSKGWVQSGTSTLRGLTAKQLSKSQFTVTACRDVTDVDVVDGSGKSVVEANRPDQQRFTYKVEKTADGFFVIEDLLKGQPCGA